MSTNPGRLPGIEGLRGIAACSILAYHAWLFSSPAKPGWNLGPITAFVPPLKVYRSQVLADWTLEEFKKSLNTFQQEPILPETAPGKGTPQRPSPSGVPR